MKKFVTLKNCLKVLAFIFGLVAALMVFANQVHYSSFYYGPSDTFFGNNLTRGSVLPFIGYLLIALGTLTICASLFLKLKGKNEKIVTLALASDFLAGGVLVFFTAGAFNKAKDFDALASLAGGPIVAGIFAILAVLSLCGSIYASDKPILK